MTRCPNLDRAVTAASSEDSFVSDQSGGTFLQVPAAVILGGLRPRDLLILIDRGEVVHEKRPRPADPSTAPGSMSAATASIQRYRRAGRERAVVATREGVNQSPYNPWFGALDDLTGEEIGRMEGVVEEALSQTSDGAFGTQAATPPTRTTSAP